MTAYDDDELKKKSEEERYIYPYPLDGNGSIELNQQGQRQQLLGSRSAQFGSAVGWAKNQNKCHVQPCHFIFFFKI